MDLELYKRFINVCRTLCMNSPDIPGNLFQTFIEERINGVSFEKFLNTGSTNLSKHISFINNNNDFHNNDSLNKENDFFIRLKNPESKNSKERGLKVCMFNNNVFKEKSINAGTNMFKFVPMIKVIGLINNNCAECGKFLCDIVGDGDGVTKEIKCDTCDFRKFCGEECKMKAMLDWHNIECEFIKFIQKEIVVVDSITRSKKQGWKKDDLEMDQNFEKTVLLITTIFRLLVCLAKNDDYVLNMICNMSDHLKIYKNYIQTGKYECIEHKEVFDDTKNTFVPLIKLFFDTNLKKIVSDSNRSGGLPSINENGIYKACFLVYVNISTVMDHLNNNLGMMFDPLFSMINHSCDPNCTLVYKNDGEIMVKNTKKLKASNEMLLNYIPVFLPREFRRKKLKASFFFDCECYKCTVMDKKFDDMLPINCTYCGTLNKGFLLENFAIYDSLPKFAKKIICLNCENIIEVEFIFKKYLEMFQFFKEINPESENIEDLKGWDSEAINWKTLTDMQFNKCVMIFKTSYGIVPLKSWPMNFIINIIKNEVQIRNNNIVNITCLRLTYLSNFLIENMLERKSIFKTMIGSSLYDLAVISAEYLFDQYLHKKTMIEKILLESIGWGTFSICILSFKHLSIRFSSRLEKDNDYNSDSFNEVLERSQNDMIQLAGEVKRLLEFCKCNYGDNGSKDVNLFKEHYLEQSLSKYESFIDCGIKKQLLGVVIPLSDRDISHFGLKREMEMEDKEAESQDFENTKRHANTYVRPQQEEIDKLSPLFETPQWITKL